MIDGLTLTGTLHNLAERYDGGLYATLADGQDRVAVLFPADLATRHDLIGCLSRVTVTGDATSETLRVESVEVVQP